MPDGEATPDLDLRLVRYFTVVAEHRHFGRAAAALHVAQPSLSRQIQKLEHQLGAQLLERGPQGAEPTPAGQVFLLEARALLAAATDGVTRVRAVASTPRITIGYASNLIVTPAVRALREEFPGAEVRTLHLDWNEPAYALDARLADAVVARVPFPTDGLTFPDRDWNEFWHAGLAATGPQDGPRVQSIEDNLELVASGGAVTLAPASVRNTKLRPDVAVVTVVDVEPVAVVVASRRDDPNPLVRRFHRLAADLGTGDG